MQKHPSSEAPAGPAPPTGAVRAGDTLLLFTHDEALAQTLASVVPQGCLTVVADEATLAGHLMTADYGVVFLDAGVAQSQPGMAAQLTQRLHEQLPDVVLVVAGDGAAQSELAALVTDGTIYRFVHKPVSAQRVKLFVEAAWRKREGSSASGVYPTLSMAQILPLAPMPRKVPWAGIATGAAVIGTAAAWLALQSKSIAPAPLPEPAPNVAAQSPQSAAIVTPAAGREPAAPVARPDPVANLALTYAAGQERTRLRTERAQLHAQRRAAGALASQVAASLAARRIAPATGLTAIAIPSLALPPAVTTAPAPSQPAAVPDIASSPALLSPPSSTPPASEARDRLSVAAVILQRVSAVDPEFPEVAREQDLSGYVDLEFLVHANGSVSDVTVLKAEPTGVFEHAAVVAVRQWRYRPIERDGIAVAGHARLRLNFGYK